MTKHMTTTDVQKKLRLTRAQIFHLLRTRPELSPPFVGAIRVWTDSDLDRVRESLAARPVHRTRPARKKRK